MVLAESSIWTEKYRPQKFSEIIGQKEIVSRVQSLVEKGSMPHLLFAGPAGIGKTTLSLVIAKTMYKENWHQNFLELNASDERGIDIIRNKVKDFARTRAIGNVPYKIIYLDECDALTKDAQQALRRTMENYASTCRFILSCNYSSKIIDPIQSRCIIFRFKPLSSEEITTIIDKIAENEGLEISEGAKNALIEVSEGDCRKLENILQGCSALTKKIDEQQVYAISSFARPKEIKEILELCSKNRFMEARKKLLKTMLDYGLAGLDIIKQIQKEILSLNTEDLKKLKMIEACADAEFRMVEGSDEFVQLEALLAKIILAIQTEK